MNKKVLVVIGTRPNFIKVTQFGKLFQAYSNIELKIVHTGQHFDDKMANVFFKQFNLEPDFFLNISAKSANSQIGEIMIELEKLIVNHFKPDLIIVVGDVNSTLAAALTANKLGIKSAHIESGLRSFDRTMPEEINRIITDEICDYYFVTEPSGYQNLINEGKLKERIFMVGNTMIDTLVAFRESIIKSTILKQLNVESKKYVLMTMHRPASVDSENGLLKIINILNFLTKDFHVVFPIHPRTLNNLKKFNLLNQFNTNSKIITTEPLDYFSFQNLILNSKLIITDSGGIQEESTFLGVPCLTLRPNTERPITCTIGTNTLMPFDQNAIIDQVNEIVNGKYKSGIIPELWDGKSTERIIDVLSKLI